MDLKGSSNKKNYITMDLISILFKLDTFGLSKYKLFSLSSRQAQTKRKLLLSIRVEVNLRTQSYSVEVRILWTESILYNVLTGIILFTLFIEVLSYKVPLHPQPFFLS
jgi:hypothetical protein